MIIKKLHNLGHNIILEQGTPKWMRKKMIFVLNAKQLAGEAGIVEIEFGTFDDPPIEVAVVWQEEEKDEAGFKYRNPPARCVN